MRVVDPEVDSITVYRREDDRYVRAAMLTLEAGDSLTTPVFPGLSLPLASVFRD